MSGGFPTRPTRAAFGPTPINRYQPRDPARDFGAEIGDLMFWTVSGCGVVVPQAWVVVKVIAGPDWELVASGEVWDADGALLPTVARDGLGTGTIEYAATYPDKDGSNVATSLKGVSIDEQVLSNLKEARAKVNANGRVIDVALFASGVANDWAVGDEFLVRAW